MIYIEPLMYVTHVIMSSSRTNWPGAPGEGVVILGQGATGDREGRVSCQDCSTSWNVILYKKYK